MAIFLSGYTGLGWEPSRPPTAVRSQTRSSSSTNGLLARVRSDTTNQALCVVILILAWSVEPAPWRKGGEDIE